MHFLKNILINFTPIGKRDHPPDIVLRILTIMNDFDDANLVYGIQWQQTMYTWSNTVHSMR